MKNLLTILFGTCVPVVLLVVSFSCTQTGEPDTIPPKVTITSPIDGTTLTGPDTVTTLITDNVGVVSAELYVDNQLIGVATSKPFTFYWYLVYWADGNNHMLQVKAKDPSGNVGSSKIVNVIVSTAALASPLVVEPTGYRYLDTTTVTLRWRPFPSAEHYEIQAATAVDSATPVFSTTTKDTECTVTNLSYADYLWRVRAYGPNGDPSGWSRGGSFSRLLPPPVGISPILGMLTEGAQTPFVWSKVPKALQYRVAVGQDTQFSSTVFSATVGDTFTSALNLPRIIRLYWRVRGVAQGGTPGHWSPAYVFSRFNTFLETLAVQPVGVIRTTSDSGYLVGGGQSVTKLDKYGTPVWQKSYSASVASLRILSGGGILLAGVTPGGGAWAARTDNLGVVQWAKTMGSQGSSFASADMLNDGNIICSGVSASSAWVVLLTAAGDTVWTQAPGLVEMNYVEATHEGGALMAGSRWDNSYTAPASPANFRSIDSGGTLLWVSEETGCNHFRQMRGLKAEEFSDGTSLAFYTLPCIPAEAFAKLDGTGRTLWNRGPTQPDHATDVELLGNVGNEFITCGYNTSSGSSYLEKFSGVGMREWRKDLGLPFTPSAVIPCADGGYLVGGTPYLIKTDASGDYITPLEKTPSPGSRMAEIARSGASQ